MRGGQGGVPVEVTGANGVGLDEELDARVLELGGVGRRGGVDVGRHGHRVVVEQVVGDLAVGVDGDVKAVLQEAHVETHVELLGGLPLEFGVGVLRGLEACHPLSAGVEVAAVRGVVVVHGERAVAAARDVAGLTVADAQLHVGDGIDVLHELLVADGPAEGGGGEVGPLTVGTELAAAFVTEGEQHVVAVVVAVAHTAEEADELVVVLAAAEASTRVLLVLEVGTCREVVVEIDLGGEVAVAGVEAGIDVVVVAVAHDGVEAVTAEGVLVLAGELKVVRGVVALRLRGRAVGRVGAARGVLGCQRVVLRGVVVLAHAHVAVGGEHQVGAPALDGLHGDVARHLRVVGTGVANLLVEDFDGVVVLEAVELLVVAQRGVLHAVGVHVVDGRRGVVDDGLAVGVRGVVLGVLAVAQVAVEVELQDAVHGLLGDVELHAHALVARVDHHALLVAVAEACGVGGVGRASLEVDGVVLCEARLGDGAQPVGREALVAEGGGARYAAQVVGRHEVEVVVEVRGAHVARVGHLGGLVELSALGGDEDDAVGAACAVDGGSGGVLQHVDGGDVLRGHLGDVARHAVDEHQRVEAAGEGGDAAQADGAGGIRVARALGDVQAGHLALDELGGILDVTDVEVLGLDAGDGRRDVALLHRTVADDHHVGEQLAVLLQGDADVGSALEGYFLGGIADVADDECGLAALHLQGEGAVDIGDDAVGRHTLFNHVGTNHFVTVQVHDGTADGGLGIEAQQGAEHQCERDKYAACFHWDGFSFGLINRFFTLQR